MRFLGAKKQAKGFTLETLKFVETLVPDQEEFCLIFPGLTQKAI
jgi:hypothetical protein